MTNTDPPRRSAQRLSPAQRLHIPPHAVAALERQAHLHYRSWNLAQAEHLARHVLRFCPDRAATHFLLGDIYMKGRRWKDALACFERSCQFGRPTAMTLCRAAEALLGMSDPSTATRYLQMALSCGAPQTDPGVQRARRILRRRPSRPRR